MVPYYVKRKTVDEPTPVKHGQELVIVDNLRAGYEEHFTLISVAYSMKMGCGFIVGGNEFGAVLMNGLTTDYAAVRNDEEIRNPNWDKRAFIIVNGRRYCLAIRASDKHLVIDLPVVISRKQPVRVGDYIVGTDYREWVAECITSDGKLVMKAVDKHPPYTEIVTVDTPELQKYFGITYE